MGEMEAPAPAVAVAVKMDIEFSSGAVLERFWVGGVFGSLCESRFGGFDLGRVGLGATKRRPWRRRRRRLGEGISGDPFCGEVGVFHYITICVGECAVKRQENDVVLIESLVVFLNRRW